MDAEGAGSAQSLLLAGDVGGTKTALAIYSPEAGPRRPLVQEVFRSAEFDSLESMAGRFLAGKDLRPSAASFGIAGPVVAGQARVTNLPWIVTVPPLGQALGTHSVGLLNDLEAIAHAVPYFEGGELETLLSGSAVPGGTIGVVAPGTGLGEAFLVWTEEGYRPYASEGGHATFGPETDLELELINYLFPKLEHVSWERVCSGIGIPNLYDFFRDTGRLPEPKWLRDELEAAADPTRVIIQAARDGTAEICSATLDLFVSILGSEAGNLALKVLATGGMYLGGGLPPRVLTRLKGESFRRAFTHKGRFAEMLSRVPVHAILKPDAALFGAAVHGLAMLSGRA